MIKIFNHYISKNATALLLIESLIFALSLYLATWVRFIGSPQWFFSIIHDYLYKAIIYAFVMIFSMNVFGMYQSSYVESIQKTFIRLMSAMAFGFGSMTLLFYLFPSLYFGRGILGLVILISTLAILLTRFMLLSTSKSIFSKSRVIVVGCGIRAKECADLAAREFKSRYFVVGFVPTKGEVCYVPPSSVLSTGDSLPYLASKYKASEIIVAVEDRRKIHFILHTKDKDIENQYSDYSNIQNPIDKLLECKLLGINVVDAATFFEREAGIIKLDYLQPSWLVFGGGFDQSFLRAVIKRIFDLFTSMIIFIVMLPLMLITALFIFLDDRGPIFYQQERVGKDGQTFRVLKFRSMRTDAEAGMDPQWATSNDPRATKVGRIIRKLRIDELPQVLNVLKGEMSFVGPRPERPHFVNILSESIPYFHVRHSIKPGITGLAQVRYQYGSSVDDAIQKLQYDLYYVKNNSLFLDLIILNDTLQVVLLGKGAR